MTQAFVIAPTNGQQVFEIPGHLLGPLTIVISAGSAPSAGVVTIEYRLPGDNTWRALPDAALKPLTGPVVVWGYGPARTLRLTIADLTGGSAMLLSVSRMEARGFPPGAFEGLRALTVQPYTEANVKNGLQYYLRAVWPKADHIAAGTARRVLLQTGAKPVIVKLRELQFDAEELTIELFTSPTGVTGGTTLSIQNYNLINPVASTLTAKKNVSTTSDGAPFDASDIEHFFGSSNAPQRSPGSIPQGRERVIPANSSFLVKITNTGTGDARAQYYLDWYEGATDLPLAF